MNIIDTFIIQLGLDTKDYKKSQKDAEAGLKKFGETSEATSKQVNASAKAMFEGFHRVKLELAGLIGAALGAKGVKDFVVGMVASQNALGRASTNLGMSVKDLDAWGKAAKRSGGSAEAMRASMQNIMGGIQDFNMGKASTVVDALTVLGVRMNKGPNGLRDALLDTADALKRFNPQEQLKIAEALGIDEGTLNLLREGRQEVAATVDKIAKTSGVTKESTEEAKKAREAWSDFSDQLHGVGERVFSSSLPAIKQMQGQLDGLGNWVNQHKDGISAFFGAIANTVSAIARGLGDALSWLTKFGESIAGTKFGNKLGELMARFFAYGGDKDAQAALAANGVAGYSAPSTTAPSPAAAAATPSLAVPATSTKLPRGARNFNPGNLNFAKQAGAVLEDNGANSRFAKFGSMEEGIAALVRQLHLYKKRGKDTISSLVNTYAPGFENDVPAYIAALSKGTGLSAGQKIDFDNSNQLFALLRGIINHEGNGKYVTDAQIFAGMGAARNNYSQMLAATRPVGYANSSVRTEVAINGPITVNSAAKEFPGTASDMAGELKRKMTVLGAVSSTQ